MQTVKDRPPGSSATRIRPLEDRLAAQGSLIELLRTAGRPGSIAALSDEQWECLVEEAGRHRLGALVWRRLSDLGTADVPGTVLDRLRPHYLTNAFRNAVLFRETALAAEALATESIPVLLLKGMHLARFVYEEPALRSMADIDLMVPRDRLADADRILAGMGYGPLPRPDIEAHCAWSNHLPAFEKAGAEVLEIHYDIERPTSPFSIDTSAIWRHARRTGLDGQDVLIPAAEHLLIHLCLHLAYHHRFERSALKGLVDVETVLRRVDDIDWIRLAATANEWGAGAFVYATLRIVGDVLGAAVPASTLDALDRAGADEAIIPVAKRYILTPSIDVSDSLIEIQRAQSWRKRLALFLRGVFLPPERLREIYGLAPGSARVWSLYPLRIVDLIRRRGSLVAHVAARTTAVTPFLGREKDRRRIQQWAGYEDARGAGSAPG